MRAENFSFSVIVIIYAHILNFRKQETNIAFCSVDYLIYINFNIIPLTQKQFLEKEFTFHSTLFQNSVCPMSNNKIKIVPKKTHIITQVSHFLSPETMYNVKNFGKK